MLLIVATQHYFGLHYLRKHISKFGEDMTSLVAILAATCGH